MAETGRRILPSRRSRPLAKRQILLEINNRDERTGVEIDSTGLDVGSPSPLDRVVDGDDDLAVRPERGEETPQQPARRLAGLPARSAERFVIAAETTLVRQSPSPRKAWVTVRLPGERTAPATNTKVRLQTGPVTHGRNTADQPTRIAAAAGTADGIEAMIRLIAAVESHRPRRARVSRRPADQNQGSISCALARYVRRGRLTPAIRRS